MFQPHPLLSTNTHSEQPTITFTCSWIAQAQVGKWWFAERMVQPSQQIVSVMLSHATVLWVTDETTNDIF